MSKVPVPIHRTPSAIKGIDQSARQILAYPDGGHPADAIDRYEPFYRAWCLTGGSATRAHDLVCDAWDRGLGDPPTLGALQAHLQRHDWHGRFSEDLQNPALLEEWMGHLTAERFKNLLLATNLQRQLLLGELHGEDAAIALQAVKSALLNAVFTTQRQPGSRRPIEAHSRARPLAISTEEINRRDADDWEHHKRQQESGS